MSIVSQSIAPNAISIPAPTSLVARVLVAAAVKAETWTQRRKTRMHLRELTPELLQDIGVQQTDAINEINKPFWKA